MAQRTGRSSGSEWKRQRQRMASWEAAERKRQAKERARQAHQDYLAEQQERASGRTREAAERLAELTGILHAALDARAAPLDLTAGKATPALPVLDLGRDASPSPAPNWADYEPREPGAIGRMLGRNKRFDELTARQRQRFDRDLVRHQQAEQARQQRVAAAQAQHNELVAAAVRAATEHNAAIDRRRERVLAGERIATSDYFQQVIDSVRLPAGCPTARRAGYVPESTMLVIEWDLPGFDVVPTDKEFRYVKTRDTVEVSRGRSITERRQAYRDLIAQIALVALYVVFRSDPADLVHTVVVNGVVDGIDSATGQPNRTCRITLRATRKHFEEVNLRKVKPVDCAQIHFAAQISGHPDDVQPVTPIVDFGMADPRIVESADVISELDRHPNLVDLTAEEFEHFIQNLFARMGFETYKLPNSGDGGVDVLAYDHDPVRGAKYVIQAKKYTHKVQPSAVRELHGTVQHEGANKGILVTTHGFTSGCYEWSNGKPLQLYDGTHLIALCRQYGIEARIVLPLKSAE
ncbi:restriction endonuclease [Amycolatopsis taiwanensis]|uniref:restriction endonuclease n=1 Tax=Amycolatopsis taiwanensis TaxID=342230 RepID=UPI0004BC444E|nr:restriction endonuclease [Amycolatopsis taiwanensis]